MNQTSLEILIKLKDEATGKLSSIANSLKGMRIPLTAVAAGAAAAGAAVVAFGISAINSYGEAQVSAARMDATLRTMGDAALKNREAILEAANAAVKLGFDDEAAAESITRFYQATGDLSKAMDLNNLAMDLARAKNLDLATATGLVNQVLSGNGRALKQYQIDLKDTASPLEALKELQERVAGQGLAFAETLPGQLKVLQESWSNIKDEIGKVLVDALLPMIKQFNAWLLNPETQKSIKIWTAEFKSWAEVIIPVIVDTFKMWYEWAQKLFDILLKVGNTITTIVSSMNNLSKNGTGGVSGLVNAFKNAGSNLAWAAGGAIPGRAAGGPVTGGMPYIVGENGPELFVPSQSGSIRANGGGVTVNINGGTYLSESVAESIGDMILQRLKLSNAI